MLLSIYDLMHPRKIAKVEECLNFRYIRKLDRTPPDKA